MDFMIDKEYDYIPVFGGNSKSDNPAVFHLKALNTIDRERCMTERMVDSTIERIINESETVRRGVKSIDNLKLSGKEIKTATDLINAEGLNMLLSEVAGVLITKVAKPDLKN